MRLYQVEYNESVLNFIAVDKDHVITLLSQLVGTFDYPALVKDAVITRVSGGAGYDEIDFYLNFG